MITLRSQKLHKHVFELYTKHKELLFHGWHHINFVTNKAKQFAEIIGANVEIVECAALVHDINYIVEINSEPEAGEKLRHELLLEAGFDEAEIKHIEAIINESHTANRSPTISEEGKALSDADTLFKAIPTTPIFFSSKYIIENNINITKLANKIVTEQRPLIDQDIYFYIPEVKAKYNPWAISAIQLWENMLEALDDRDIVEMLDIAKNNGAI
jgi:uncharacterized protein